MKDSIHIEQLELSAYIGVPDEERRDLQRLTVSLTLEPERTFGALEDRIENTINYLDVARAVQALTLARPRKLIETLVEEIAAELLVRFSLSAIEIELRKFILPDTAFVAVRIRREKITP